MQQFGNNQLHKNCSIVDFLFFLESCYIRKTEAHNQYRLVPLIGPGRAQMCSIVLLLVALFYQRRKNWFLKCFEGDQPIF